MHPLLAISITLASLILIMAVASWGSRSGKFSSEIARKFVHVGMGILCLSFPWLFDDVWAVQALAGMAVVSLIVVRRSKLRSNIGSGLFSVSRVSIGELLFPIAVAWIFTLSHGSPLVYCISLLQLTLADTASALAGVRYGKRHYQTSQSTKSVEGTLAFFITAFACTALPLHYFTPELSWLHLLAISTAIAGFSSIVEGMAGRGLDNFLIPVGSYLLLDYYLGLTTLPLLIRIATLIFLLGLLLLTAKRHHFNGGTILGAVLFGFAAFTMGGWACLGAALFLLARHIYAQRAIPSETIASHHLPVILGIAIPAIGWLTLGRRGNISYPDAQLGFLTTLAFIIAMLHASTQLHHGKSRPSLLRATVLALAMLSFVAFTSISPAHYLPLVIATLILAPSLSAVYFFWIKISSPEPYQASHHWIKLSILGAIGSAAIHFLLTNIFI